MSTPCMFAIIGRFVVELLLLVWLWLFLVVYSSFIYVPFWV